MVNPKLRFKKPDGTAYLDWETVQLADIATRVTRKNKDGETDVPLTIASIEGLVDQRTYFGKTVASKDMSGYFLLKKGEFAYNKSYSVGYDYGAIKRLDKYDQGALSTLYICFALNDTSWSDYMVQYFDSQKWNAEMPKICAEGARNHGLLNVAPTDFFKISMALPTDPEERDRIVAGLQRISERIECQASRVTALETQKKELLRQVFAREIRFKDENGQDYPEWEKVTVLDLLVQPITDGPHETPELVESGVPFASVEAVVNGKIDLSRRRGNITKEYDEACAKKYKPQKYDVYMVKSGATTGKVAIVTIDEDFNIWSPLAAMRTRNKIEAYYLFYFLQSAYLQDQVLKKMSLGNQPNLGMRALEAFSAFRPSLTEQQRIADFFMALDAQIENEWALLEDWRQLKKGLLQQMFV